MTVEALIANAEDLARIQRLADAGHFAPWFPAYSRKAVMRCMGRVMALAITYRLIPYPGPVVTE